jgi:hypothetical protein
MNMLLRHRPPGIDSTPAQLRAGFEHLEPKAIAVLRWLNANKIDYVVVGPVGHAIRGDLIAKGAVAIVPAPYGRNYDRLARALIAEHAGLRSERGLPGGAARSETVSVKLSGEKLARGRRWLLRFGEYDLDVERSGQRAGGENVGRPSQRAGGGAAAPSPPNDELHAGSDAGARYQELLYEANRFDLCEQGSVQVAAPEDLEHYSHVRRTGSAPEFRVTRSAPEASQESSQPDGSSDRADLTSET